MSFTQIIVSIIDMKHKAYTKKEGGEKSYETILIMQSTFIHPNFPNPINTTMQFIKNSYGPFTFCNNTTLKHNKNKTPIINTNTK